MKPVRNLFVAILLSLLIPSIAAIAQPDHDHDLLGKEAPRCGTFALASLYADGRIPTEKERRLLGLTCDSREVMQNSILSSNGHFRIHYDRTGRNAVAVADLNGNDIPDYIDSVSFYLEYAWDVEINQYGYDAPADDHRDGGPETDVYICALDASFYGYAIPEFNNTTGPNTVAGFLVLDNDYVGYPTPGIKGLAVTTAHEFQHIVQFNRYRVDLSQASIYEATAVWFEQICHPNIPDYRQYVDSLLLSPQNYGFSTNATQTSVTGYCHVLYFDYIAKRLDPQVIRHFWERFRDEPIIWKAMDEELRTRSLNLSDSYCEFAEWSYRTGSRAQDSMFLPGASTLPTMRQALRRNFTGEDLPITDALYPLSFGLYQVTMGRNDPNIRDTVDFLITNTNSSFGKGTPQMPQEAFTIQISSTPHDGYRPVRGPNDSVFYKVVSTSNTICARVILDGRPQSYVATRISPQPFISDGARRLVFNVPTTEQITSARLTIYTASMGPVATVEQTGLVGYNNLLGVVWDGRDALGVLAASGIYLYELSINDGTPTLGKFALIRQ